MVPNHMFEEDASFSITDKNQVNDMSVLVSCWNEDRTHVIHCEGKR